MQKERTLLDGTDFIKEYLKNKEKYLPLHPLYMEKERTGIGWNAGIIEGNRPYFADCWTDSGFTFLDYYIPEEGLENITDDKLLEKFIAKEFFSLRPEAEGCGYDVCSINFVCEADDGVRYICFQVIVGDEDDTFIDGCQIYPYSVLEDFEEKNM